MGGLSRGCVRLLCTEEAVNQRLEALCKESGGRKVGKVKRVRVGRASGNDAREICVLWVGRAERGELGCGLSEREGVEGVINERNKDKGPSDGRVEESGHSVWV